ncbi:MAG TPA: hypothetical protein PKC73_13780, partial [Dermatophilaceae bacterium]|nr:hypothetical protein [Dermatophilaceae bacterium]
TRPLPLRYTGATESADLTVGGVLAVGLPDEVRVVVGSHAGVGIVDVTKADRAIRLHDNDYRWFDEERMAILIPDGRGGQEVVAAMGLAGGQLPTSTHDGWRCERTDLGATLVRDDQLLKIADQEEFRACGFSPRGSVFILATSPNLTVLKRDLALEQKL